MRQALPDYVRLPRKRPPRSVAPLTAPAWTQQREAWTPLPSPRRAMNDPRTMAYYQPPTREMIERDRELERFARMHEMNRNEVNTPPGTYFGQDTLEMTGLPSIARGVGHLRDGEPGEALPEMALGGLGVFGMFAGAGARPGATPPRVPRIPRVLPEIAEEARLPNAPARLPGRATDGSVLPIRPPEPIRQSMVGGSDDLVEAARMQPDAGGARLEQLRAQGFDVENQLYRGHEGDPSTGHWRASEGLNGEGVYLTHDPAQADKWATRQATNDPTVHTVYVRGPITENMTFEEARAAGYSGLRYRGEQGYDETVIFDPADVSPSIARRPPTQPDGGSAQAGRDAAYIDQLRADGFDVERPLYHGMPNEMEGATFRASPEGLFPDTVSLTHDPARAARYAGAGGQVIKVYARGGDNLLRDPLTGGFYAYPRNIRLAEPDRVRFRASAQPNAGPPRPPPKTLPRRPTQ